MSVLRSTGLIDAPASLVGAALRHVATAEEGLREVGVRGRSALPSDALLCPGDEIGFRFRTLPGTLRTRVVRADETGMGSVLVAGPWPRLRHETTLAEVGRPRTLVTESVEWRSPGGPLGRIADVAVVRRLVLRVLARRMTAVRELVAGWQDSPVIVGTAVVHKGLLLVQQRRYPAAAAGKWELPGGRVEAGESESDAVRRECAEELDVAVEPLGPVGTDVPLPGGKLLRIHAASLVEPDAQPRAVEHRAVRWIGPAELADLDWLDADRLVLHSLRELLRTPAP